MEGGAAMTREESTKKVFSQYHHIFLPPFRWSNLSTSHSEKNKQTLIGKVQTGIKQQQANLLSKRGLSTHNMHSHTRPRKKLLSFLFP